MDKIYGIRKHAIHKFREIMLHHGIHDVTIKLGGETSFDIFPDGWDKTYALNHFPDHKIWFLGDRCGDNGNDKEIFDALQPECSFWVDGTKHTKEVLEEILIPKLGEK